MENPNSWRPLEQAIAEALEKHSTMTWQGSPLWGPSAAKVIAEALRKKGLVNFMLSLEHAAPVVL